MGLFFELSASGLADDIPAALDREASDFRTRYPADTHPGSDTGNLIDKGVRTAVDLVRGWPGRIDVSVSGTYNPDGDAGTTYLSIYIETAPPATAAVTADVLDAAGGVAPTTVGTGEPGAPVTHEAAPAVEPPSQPTTPNAPDVPPVAVETGLTDDQLASLPESSPPEEELGSAPVGSAPAEDETSETAPDTEAEIPPA